MTPVRMIHVKFFAPCCWYWYTAIPDNWTIGYQKGATNFPTADAALDHAFRERPGMAALIYT